MITRNFFILARFASRCSGSSHILLFLLQPETFLCQLIKTSQVLIFISLPCTASTWSAVDLCRLISSPWSADRVSAPELSELLNLQSQSSSWFRQRVAVRSVTMTLCNKEHLQLPDVSQIVHQTEKIKWIQLNRVFDSFGENRLERRRWKRWCGYNQRRFYSTRRCWAAAPVLLQIQILSLQARKQRNESEPNKADRKHGAGGASAAFWPKLGHMQLNLQKQTTSCF